MRWRAAVGAVDQAVWFAGWYVVVLLPSVVLIALTGWVPAWPGGLLLLAGCTLAGYSVVLAGRRLARGSAPSAPSSPTVWAALAAIGRGLMLTTVPAAPSIALGVLLQREDDAGAGAVAGLAVWVLAIVAWGLSTLLAFWLLYLVLRLLFVVWATVRGRRAGPLPGLRTLPGGDHWIGVVCVVLFGALAAGQVVGLVYSATMWWRYHHAPACSAVVTSSCRSIESVTVVDIGPDHRGRLQLTTDGGVRAIVTGRPEQWQLDPVRGLAATLESFDGEVVVVSAAGIARRTTEHPDPQMAFFMSSAPAGAGLVWFARAAMSRRTRQRSPRRELLRPIGLAIVLGGLVVVLPNALLGGSSPAVEAVLQLALGGLVFLTVRAWRLTSAPPAGAVTVWTNVARRT